MCTDKTEVAYGAIDNTFHDKIVAFFPTVFAYTVMQVWSY